MPAVDRLRTLSCQVCFAEVPGHLSGKVAVVTGGATGIGKAIALALARSGASLVLASRSLERLGKVAAAVRELGQEALVVVTDVTDAEQVDAMMAKTMERFGRVDVLVNNAGGALYSGPPEKQSPQQWRDVIALNLDSVFFCSSAAAKIMMKQKGGKIINVSSQAGVTGPFQANMSSYGAAKAGVNNLSEALASAWAEHNITVNAVTPGAISTAYMKKMGAIPVDTRKDGTQKSPLRLAPTPAKVADLVLFLASAAADMISGETIGISADFHLDRA